MVIHVNTEIPQEFLDDDVRYDTSVVNIGYCVCGTMTQTEFRVQDAPQKLLGCSWGATCVLLGYSRGAPGIYFNIY